MAKSIVTSYEDISAFSGRPAQCTHHLIMGSGLRKLADEDGLTIPLTHDEHNTGMLIERIHGNPAAEHLSRMVGQLAWEKHKIAMEGCTEFEARESFRKRYSISYL